MSVSSLISFLKLGTAMKVKISASGVSKLTMKIFTYLPKLKYCACAAWQQLISWAGREKVKQHVGFDYSPRAAAAVITSTIGNQLDRGKRDFFSEGLLWINCPANAGGIVMVELEGGGMRYEQGWIFCMWSQGYNITDTEEVAVIKILLNQNRPCANILKAICHTFHTQSNQKISTYKFENITSVGHLTRHDFNPTGHTYVLLMDRQTNRQDIQ